MIDFPYLPSMVRKSKTKIIMVVLGGIGGAPDPVMGRTALEAARVPNLDNIARQSSGGLTIPVAPGISPGSAVGNLALLGYDPLSHVFGRGALEALGSGLDIQAGDIALRGNLAVIDGERVVVDRRANGIPKAAAAPIIEKLKTIQVPGAEITLAQGLGHRFAVRLRGAGLSAAVTDTDPLEAGQPLATSSPTDPVGKVTAQIINDFTTKAIEVLADEPVANAVLLRGATERPDLKSFNESYTLNAAGISAFPLFLGIAEATGMTSYPVEPNFAAHLAAIRTHWDDHDFFWIHYKEPSATAGIADFNEKKRALEKVDVHVRELLDLDAGVLVVAGDLSNPTGHNGHSWHAVPFVIRSAGALGDSGVERFNERDLRFGSLGQFESKHAMMLILAHAGKLNQFEA
jgi:2,3-bisphosphoglycerate-independent phosphoglycerate mutase